MARAINIARSHTGSPGAGLPRLCAVAAMLVAVLGVVYSGAAAGSPGKAVSPAVAPRVTGFTAPVQSVTLASVRTGRVSERCVVEGGTVTFGTPVIKLDAATAQRRVDLAEARATSLIEIELAEVRVVQARSDLERLRGARELSAATANEISDAEADLRATELELAKSKFEHDQAVRELALERAVLEEFTIRAPFDGILTEHLKDVGDTLEDREAIASLVKLDPLVVTADCPIELAPGLRVGSVAEISGGERFGPARAAKVVFVSPVADAASQTFRVKLHVPNSDGKWLAGMRVEVMFGDGEVAATSSDPPAAGARR